MHSGVSVLGLNTGDSSFGSRAASRALSFSAGRSVCVDEAWVCRSRRD